MTAEALTDLVAIEYALCVADSDLADLIRSIQPTGLDGAARSCLELRDARRLVRRALNRLSRPIAAKADAFDAAR